MKTTIFNLTPFIIEIHRLPFRSHLGKEISIMPRGAGVLKIDTNATYREYDLRSSLDDFKSTILLTSDDFTSTHHLSDADLEENEAIIFIVFSDGVLLYEARRRGDSGPNNLEVALKTVKRDVSPKFGAASRSCIRLKRLLNGVKICHQQCNHLVEACVEGVQKMAKLYSPVAENTSKKLQLFNSGRLEILITSLDRLDCILCDAKDLVEACAKELGRIALVASMPMPPEKNMEVSSMFDLLLGELMWNLDLIEYALQSGDIPEALKLEWSSTVSRYVLRRSNGSRPTVDGEATSAEKKPIIYEDDLSLARVDRNNLQSSLEDGSISIPDTSGNVSRFLHLCRKPDKNLLNNVIIKRCKVQMHLDQNHSMDLRSLSLNLDSFKIDHLHLKLNSKLGSGTFKTTYEGEWLGQRVVIATMRDFEEQDLRNEVQYLLLLQHPKVVRFLGWACTEDAPAPIKKPEEVEGCRGGYIVTEKMEFDLEYLINTAVAAQKAATKKTGSGGPFSHAVGLDILLQIVEAVLHVHKHSVMHRDLKPGNVLVNSRSSPRSAALADKYYDVKLIDFGSSKLWGEEKNTYNRGTSRYGAPEMMVGKDRGGEEKGKYDRSVDVFSFAMTGYQVITGAEPFRRFTSHQALELIRNGKRPDFPVQNLYGLKQLIEECWDENPHSRPTFEDIQYRLWTIRKELAVPHSAYV